jgi:hypothetical protein
MRPNYEFKNVLGAHRINFHDRIIEFKIRMFNIAEEN